MQLDNISLDNQKIKENINLKSKQLTLYNNSTNYFLTPCPKVKIFLNNMGTLSLIGKKEWSMNKQLAIVNIFCENVYF